MSSEPTPLPVHMTRLAELDEAWRALSAGERFDQIRHAAPRLKERIGKSGKVVAVRTFDLQDVPYPTRFAFGGTASSPMPFIVFTNRANLVQIDTPSGLKTLLFNPTDVDRSAETPFFSDLRARMGKSVSKKVMQLLKKPSPAEYLGGVGVAPEDVDYIAFDHLHTQDLRRILGTEARDGEPLLRGMFPNAKLLIWRRELEIFRSLHPLQAWWYVPECLRGIDPARFVIFDCDVLLGAGAALVRTPGHTVGNWSLVLSTESGMWAISENGVACDSYAPDASSIPGLRKNARIEGIEVVLNSNTLEGRNEQYTSMILERSLVDRAKNNPDFYQHLASSELKATPFTPGLSPTYRHGGVKSGELRARATSSVHAAVSVSA